MVEGVASHHEEGDEEEGAGEVDQGGLAVDGLAGFQARDAEAACRCPIH